MSDVNNVQPTQETVSQNPMEDRIITPKFNAFADEHTRLDGPTNIMNIVGAGDESNKTPETKTVETTLNNEEKKPEAPEQKNDEIFDANEYIKRELDYDDWETAKNDIKSLREKAKKAEELELAANKNKLFLDDLEGKEDDIYRYLNEKKRLEKAEKLDVSKVSDAAEIIKLELQHKHKDLTQDEIDHIYNKRYGIPEKPSQRDDQTDEEYQSELSRWQRDVQLAEKDLIIAAKMAKPELSKYKNELVLPDIPKKETQPQTQQVSQEELAKQQKAYEDYLSKLKPTINSITGFSTTVKDEEVDMPVSYTIADDEKEALVKRMENFDPMEYLTNRWVTKEGTLDIAKMAKDVYRLENEEKIDQKIANEASAKRLAEYIKLKSNIQVGPDAQKQITNNAPANRMDKVRERAFAD